MKKLLCLVTSLLILNGCQKVETQTTTTSTPTPTQVAQGKSQETATYQEGLHYIRLAEPISYRLEAGKTAHILEFFQYTCGHCANIHGLIKEWKPTLGDQVQFEMMHVYRMDPYGRAFLASRFLNMDGDAFDDQVFAYLHEQKETIQSLQDFAPVVTALGQSMDKFEQAAQSIVVNSQVNQAVETSKQVEQGLQALGMRGGTPMFIVNGEFVVKGEGIKTYEDMLKVAQYLAQR